MQVLTSVNVEYECVMLYFIHVHISGEGAVVTLPHPILTYRMFSVKKICLTQYMAASQLFSPTQFILSGAMPVVWCDVSIMIYTFLFLFVFIKIKLTNYRTQQPITCIC